MKKHYLISSTSDKQCQLQATVDRVCNAGGGGHALEKKPLPDIQVIPPLSANHNDYNDSRWLAVVT